MKSSTQIRFDFQNAKQQANRLDELANSLEQQVIRPMSDTAQQLHSAWTGESANRFTAKQSELQEKIRRTSSSLRNLPDGCMTLRCRLTTLPSKENPTAAGAEEVAAVGAEDVPQAGHASMENGRTRLTMANAVFYT